MKTFFFNENKNHTGLQKMHATLFDFVNYPQWY